MTKSLQQLCCQLGFVNLGQSLSFLLGHAQTALWRGLRREIHNIYLKVLVDSAQPFPPGRAESYIVLALHVASRAPSYPFDVRQVCYKLNASSCLYFVFDVATCCPMKQGVSRLWNVIDS
jgi:hypothetical protein